MRVPIHAAAPATSSMSSGPEVTDTHDRSGPQAKRRLRSRTILQAMAETDIDLPALRRSPRITCTAAAPGGTVDPSATLTDGIAPLRLGPGDAQALLADTRLILDWYRMPWASRGTPAGSAMSLDILAKFLTAADAIASLRYAELRQADRLLRSDLAGRTPPHGRIDILRIHSDVKTLSGTISETLAQFEPPKGRPLTLRRDRCLALLGDAVFAASGRRVRVSPRSTTPTARRFENDAGRFVLAVMSSIGWSDEHVLVGAFERMRSQTRRNERLRPPAPQTI